MCNHARSVRDAAGRRTHGEEAAKEVWKPSRAGSNRQDVGPGSDSRHLCHRTALVRGRANCGTGAFLSRAEGAGAARQAMQAVPAELRQLVVPRCAPVPPRERAGVHFGAKRPPQTGWRRCRRWPPSGAGCRCRSSRVRADERAHLLLPLSMSVRSTRTQTETVVVLGSLVVVSAPRFTHSRRGGAGNRGGACCRNPATLASTSPATRQRGRTSCRRQTAEQLRPSADHARAGDHGVRTIDARARHVDGPSPSTAYRPTFAPRDRDTLGARRAQTRARRRGCRPSRRRDPP